MVSMPLLSGTQGPGVLRRNQSLDITAFKSAEDYELLRAGMVCSLIRKHNDYIGMHRSEILKRFEPSTGYYYTEMTLAYLI